MLAAGHACGLPAWRRLRLPPRNEAVVVRTLQLDWGRLMADQFGTVARLRQTLSMLTIRGARRVLAHTPVERWPITSWLRGRVFRYGYGDSELSVTVRGVTLSLPGGDASIVPSLVGGYYEELELAIFEQLARDASLIADVGGNIGLYSCVGAAAAPSIRVVAFEPAPLNLDYLRRNVNTNGLAERVEVVAAAVSDQPGTARLHLADGIGNHSLAAGRANSQTYVDVEVKTIDGYFADERLDLLKVDVEGFDVHVLRGAKSRLHGDRPAVFVELLTERLEEGGAAPQELVTMLCDSYGHVFVVDEPRRVVREASREELLALVEERVHTNLIAVERPEQVAVVAGFIG